MSNIQKLRTTKERNANLDLLRIISMFLIVLLHSIDHSGVLESIQIETGFIYLYEKILHNFTQICVNCFVLLSGYFLVKSKFRISKIISLWIEVVFYALLFKIIFMISGAIPFSFMSLASCFFPITTGRYWFVTIYIGMYLLAPFLNKAIFALNKKQMSALVVILFILMSVWVSVHPKIAGMNSGGGWGLAWFVTLYITAAWFRLHYQPNKKHISLAIICLVNPIIVGCALFVSQKYNIGILTTVASNWYKYDSVPVFFSTISLFIAMLNITIKNKISTKIITAVAPLTFGVYLIHAHANVDPSLWSFLNLPDKLLMPSFPLYQILVCVLIFAVGIAIDFFRQLLFRPIDGWIRKSNTIGKLETKISSYIQ